MSDAIVGLKLRLMLGEDTKRILDGQSRICNWLYNHLVEKANGLKSAYCASPSAEIGKILYTQRGLRNLIPGLKEEHAFLKGVHSSPLKNAALRLSETIQAYQKSRKGRRNGKQTGWPGFRSWKRNWFSLFYDEPNKGFKIYGNQLQLSLGLKQGSVSMVLLEANRLKGKTIRNLRIVKNQNEYYAVFSVIKSLATQKPINNLIALDPNHENLAYGVGTDGKAIEIQSPHWLKQYDKRIDELKSKRDRCQKKSKKLDILDLEGNPTGKFRYEPSKRWLKYQSTLERALQKRREQTKSYLYAVANQLFKQYDYIAVGNYTPHGNGITTPMRRAMNNRSLIGRFKETLSWVALKSGKLYLEYDEKGTTRTCHVCDYKLIDGLSPQIRHWQCPRCSASHGRDENAACNGLRKIVSQLPAFENSAFALSVPSSGRVHLHERWAWRVYPRGVVSSSRGINRVNDINAKKLNGSLLGGYPNCKQPGLTYEQV